MLLDCIFTDERLVTVLMSNIIIALCCQSTVQEGKCKWTKKYNDAREYWCMYIYIYIYVCVGVIVCEKTDKDGLETIAKMKDCCH